MRSRCLFIWLVEEPPTRIYAFYAIRLVIEVRVKEPKRLPRT